VHTEFRRGDPTERNDFEYLGVDGRIILKCILKNWDGKAWAGLFCIKTGTGGKGL
jgi:hypothetical protein